MFGLEWWEERENEDEKRPDFVRSTRPLYMQFIPSGFPQLEAKRHDGWSGSVWVFFLISLACKRPPKSNL